MIRMIKEMAVGITRSLGYDISRYEPYTQDMEKEFRKIHKRVRKFTMTATEELYSLYTAVSYVIKAKIPGDMVECGVWKGGSSMAIALTSKLMSDMAREIYLYDTYAGMSKPTREDIENPTGFAAMEEWKQKEKDSHNDWCYSPVDEVRRNMLRTGYPTDKFHFVEGMVEDTIPGTIPKRIALLRLDTDFYKSTLHELEHLYPRLSRGGVLIIDDYGYWAGQKKAVDEYLKKKRICLFLSRINRDCRIGIKR